MLRNALSILATWASLGTTVVLAADAPVTTAAPAAHAHAPWAATLAARGVTLGGSMTGLWIGDVAGGVKTGGVYNTLGFASLDADLSALVGWRGGHAFVNGAWIRGGSATWSFVGDALTVSNLDGFDSIRLYDAWLQQDLGGRASIRAGCLSADEEFGGTEGGAMLTNGAFGWNAGIGANIPHGGPIYYAPGLGVRIEATPVAGWTARVGAFDGDTFDSPEGRSSVNAHGTHFVLSREQGAFLLGELSRGWGADAPRRRGVASFGAWRHTAVIEDARLDAAGEPFERSGLEPAEHHGTQGAYGVLEQRLWSATADGARGVGGWTRVAFAPPDRSAFSFVGEAGLRWNGPFAARPDDAIGLGVVHAAVSPAARDAVRDEIARDGIPHALPDHERVIELAYAASLARRWTVTPDVQWVQHPGASRAIRDAVVLGLRVSFE